MAVELRRVEGEMGLEGVLERHEIPFSVGIVMTTSNAEDVLDTSRYLLSNYSQLNTLNLESLQPTVVLEEGYFGYVLDSKRVVRIYEDVTKLLLELKRKDVKIAGVLDDCSNIKDGAEPLLETYGFKSCTAGLLRAGVFANGEVTPCVTLRTLSLGNLYAESWREIWKKSRERFVSLDVEGGQCHFNNLLRKNKVSKENLKVHS